MALLRRAICRGSKYALGATDEGLLLCNIRKRELTRVEFPPQVKYGFKFLSSCTGLVLASGRPEKRIYPHEEKELIAIGNPVSEKWKILPPHPLVEQFNGALLRNPLHNSVQLFAAETFGGCCCSYDFEADRWIPGPDHNVWRRLESNLAFHRGFLYGVYTDLDSVPRDGSASSVEGFENMTLEECLNAPDSMFKECEYRGLFRCRVDDGPEALWTRLELPSALKRLLGRWGEQRLIIHRDRLLLYVFDDNHFENIKDDPWPRVKRRCVQRMFEVFDDGKIAEDDSWIEAADKLDPDGFIPVQSWSDIVYGDKNEDFCWITHRCCKVNEMIFDLEDITLHSGVDGSLSHVTGLDIHDFINFEDLKHGECDGFLST